MTQPTKEPRGTHAPQHRVRMPAGKSASVKGRVRGVDRARARRRGPRFLSASRVSMILVCAALIVMICLGFGWYQYEKEKHRFDGYPIRYEEAVAAASEEFDLEPAYLYAVILAESGFRPEAVSGVGARGLMQVMPETGEWISGKLEMDEPYTEEMLFDPKINVRFGGWYLRFLLDRYSGDKRVASAAYHAGQGTVDHWLKDPSMSPDGATLSVIGSSVTDHYVDKVLKNYETYLALLAKDG